MKRPFSFTGSISLWSFASVFMGLFIIRYVVQNPPMHFHRHDILKSIEKNSRTAAICCLARDEEAYIDEWVDYHLALGFSEIFIYDNSVRLDDELESWKKYRRLGDSRINIIPWPGSGQQYPSYLDCAKKAILYNHTWAAFFDIDEFLVLRKHRNVLSFLEEFCQSGAISVNWFFFGSNNFSTYWPEPVTKRFNMRLQQPDHFVKSIVKLSDMNFDVPLDDPHYFHLIEGTTQRDTNNNKSNFGSNNANGPVNIAVIHHYWTKSRKEFHWKACRRGDSTVVNASDPAHALKCSREVFVGEVYDDTAWIHLKKLVPWYKSFDEIPNP